MSYAPTDPFATSWDDQPEDPGSMPPEPPPIPGGDGWWEFINGAWRWIRMPLPGSISGAPAE